MARKAKAKAPGADPNAWMVTFGDLITLLLTFFVLLLSMSSLDSNNFKEMANASSGNFLNLLDSKKVSVRFFNIVDLNMLKKMRQEIEAASKNLPTKVDVKIKNQKGAQNSGRGEKQDKGVFDATQTQKTFTQPGKDEELATGSEQPSIVIATRFKGIQITLPEEISFDPGEAKLKEGARRVIRTILDVAIDSDLSLTVLGHTDNRPVQSTEFESNWQLSCARSASVARFVSFEDLLPPNRIRISGFGPSRPIRRNHTAKGSLANRRIELWLEPASNWANAVKPIIPMSLFKNLLDINGDIDLVPDLDIELEGEPEFDPFRVFKTD
jgi:chemotaxis protein MotB